MTTDFADMFGDTDTDEAVEPTLVDDPATLHMLRMLDANRALAARLDDDNREISAYLAEQYAGQKRLVWIDSQGRRRGFRVSPPTETYEPGVQGLTWLRINHHDIYEKVTKRVLDTRAYARARKQGWVTDEMHEAMLPRDDDGNLIPARTRRATVTLPAPRQAPRQQDNTSTPESTDASA